MPLAFAPFVDWHTDKGGAVCRFPLAIFVDHKALGARVAEGVTGRAVNHNLGNRGEALPLELVIEFQQQARDGRNVNHDRDASE
jgi:hypothetical protein